MSERRKLQRRQLIFYLKVYDCESGEIVGYLGDITAEGLMLISKTSLELDKIFKLRLELPVDIFGMTSVDFEAQSLWCRPGVNADLFDIGFRMTDASSVNLEAIVALIIRYSFGSSG